MEEAVSSQKLPRVGATRDKCHISKDGTCVRRGHDHFLANGTTSWLACPRSWTRRHTVRTMTNPMHRPLYEDRGPRTRCDVTCAASIKQLQRSRHSNETVERKNLRFRAEIGSLREEAAAFKKKVSGISKRGIPSSEPPTPKALRKRAR
ncbi:hypothetical protein KM043_013889 [Ampulex compressa]|nr:hypothetical protein KM043_013889 [Ampulex compressa]